MDFLQKVDLWKKYDNLDSELKNELNNMSIKELEEAFTQDIEFGTGGLRGILGAGTNRLNIYVIMKATLGFARYLKKYDNATSRGVVIAFDNRHKSKEFSLIAAKVLCALDFKVYLYSELRPTPQLSYTVRHFNAIGGIMITASHNPKEYNGYKIYDETGCQLTLDNANKVIEEINNIDDYFNIELKENDLITYLNDEIDDIYINDISKIIINNNYNKDFKIVYTPLHGTGQVYAHKVLQNLGYDVYPVYSQMTNDPDFSGVKTSNPENKEAYIEAIMQAEEINASLVLATDPDADRLGVGVLHNNEYVLMTGNESASVIFDYIVKHKEIKENSYLFTTIVSSTLPKLIASKHNIKTIETLTGFKFIGEKIHEIENTGNFVFGFEESYGCLISDCVRDKDSIQALIMLCEAASYYKTQNKTLIDALEDIYKEYGYMKNDITNISLQGLSGIKRINEIMDYFKNNDIDIKDIVIKEDYSKSTSYNYITKKTISLDNPKSNVVKFYLSDNSWFVLRPSGTEPKLKIYYSITGNKEELDSKLEKLSKEILGIIEGI